MQEQQPRIFIIEDNPVFQTLMLKQLDDIKRDIQVYGDGESFLLENKFTAADIIILDYQLEGTITGYDILKELKKLEHIPSVIFFSGNLEISITSSILKLGVVEYIEKNIFSLARLKNSIVHVMGNYLKRSVA